MSSQVNRGRLIYPIAAALAAGLVSVPQPAAPLPRLAEVSAIRLQAEATSLVGGLDETTVAALPHPAPAAAAGSSTYNPNYTVFDNFLWSLPTNVRNAVLPAVYAVAWVMGAVIGAVYLVARPVLKLLNIDPFKPAAAAAVAAGVTGSAPVQAESPAAVNPATTATEPVVAHAPPGTPSSAPGVTPKAESVDVGSTITAEDSASVDPGPRTSSRTASRTAAEPLADAAQHRAPVPQQGTRARGRSATAGAGESAAPAAATRSAR